MELYTKIVIVVIYLRNNPKYIHVNRYKESYKELQGGPVIYEAGEVAAVWPVAVFIQPINKFSNICRVEVR